VPRRYAIKVHIPSFRVTGIVVTGADDCMLEEAGDAQNTEFIELASTLWCGGCSVARIDIFVAYCPAPTALAVTSMPATPTCQSIDLAIVLDCTRSMGRYLAMTKCVRSHTRACHRPDGDRPSLLR
jgi:hypothetical protein